MHDQVFCVYDFISDIWVAQANAHARQTQLHNLGYTGALLLCVSGLANCLVFRRVRNKHERLFQRMLKKAPLQWHICRLLACTNPEVVCSFLATQIDIEHPAEAHEIQVTSRELKELGVITQSFEDIPQFIVQAYSAFLCVVNGWTLTWQVIASLCASSTMLLIKLLINCLAGTSEGDACCADWSPAVRLSWTIFVLGCRRKAAADASLRWRQLTPR